MGVFGLTALERYCNQNFRNDHRAGGVRLHFQVPRADVSMRAGRASGPLDSRKRRAQVRVAPDERAYPE
jgi:hypothetical protein